MIIVSEKTINCILNVEINNEIYTIVKVYVPTIAKHRVCFFKGLSKWINQFTPNNYYLILGGDFNTCVSTSDKTSNQLNKCTKFLNVNDSWKHCNKFKQDFTWVNPGDSKMQSRIDYIFTSDWLLYYANNCTICPAPVPDSKAVILTLDTKNEKRGSGNWKLNVSILNDSKYQKGIKDLFRKTLEEYNENIDKRLLWDLYKIRVKEFSIVFCRNKAKEHKSQINIIEKQIVTIEEAMRLFPNEQYLLKYKELKNSLNTLL